MNNTRTIVVLLVLFLAGGLHALVGFLSPTLYAIINALLLALESYLQIGTAVAVAAAKRAVSEMEASKSSVSSQTL